MKIDYDKLKYISDLSKLDVINDKKMVEELINFISYMDILDNVDTKDIEPLFHNTKYNNVFRDDIEDKSVQKEEMLRNSNLKNDDFIVVPKTI